MPATLDAAAALRPFLDLLAGALAPTLARLVAEQLGARPAGDDGTPMTYAVAAARAGLPASALREAARRGDLAVTRLGVRTVRIAAADLDRWLRRRRVPARDESPRLRVAGGGR